MDIQWFSQVSPLRFCQDAFHDVSDVRPFHLPHIFHPKPGSRCGTSSTCVVNATTVTMAIYDLRDGLDTGLWPLSATELRVKFKSREAFRQQAGEQANFTETEPRRAPRELRASYIACSSRRIHARNRDTLHIHM